MEPKVTLGMGTDWNHNANWQVIFKTVAGLDYCRETLPASMTLAAVNQWVVEKCRQHNLAGADIQRF